MAYHDGSVMGCQCHFFVADSPPEVADFPLKNLDLVELELRQIHERSLPSGRSEVRSEGFWVGWFWGSLIHVFFVIKQDYGWDYLFVIHNLWFLPNHNVLSMFMYGWDYLFLVFLDFLIRNYQ